MKRTERNWEGLAAVVLRVYGAKAEGESAVLTRAVNDIQALGLSNAAAWRLARMRKSDLWTLWRQLYNAQP